MPVNGGHTQIQCAKCAGIYERCTSPQKPSQNEGLKTGVTKTVKSGVPAQQPPPSLPKIGKTPILGRSRAGKDAALSE
jgi:hypothetical protein